MSLHHDLLEQSRFLLRREARRPRQASLRRAVSAAYYALFHLLIYEASRMFVRDEAMIALIARTYSHGKMFHVALAFAGGHLPAKLTPIKANSDDLAMRMVHDKLKMIAGALKTLQQYRHEADYNLGRKFTRSEVRELIEQAEQAFSVWQQIRNEDLARVFLGSFLLWDEWNKKR